MAIAGLLLLLAPVIDLALAAALGAPIGLVIAQPIWLLTTIFLFIVPGIFLLIAGGKYSQRQNKGLVIAGSVVGLVLCAILLIFVLIGLMQILRIGMGSGLGALIMFNGLFRLIVAILGIVMPAMALASLGRADVAAAFERNQSRY